MHFPPGAPPHPLLALTRDWRLFRNCVLIGTLVAAASLLAVGRTYTTTVSFVPQGSRSGQLRGLAAQFGFDVAGSEGAESPYFYVGLLQTKEVLSRVVTNRFDDGETAGDYATFVKISATDSAVRTDKAIKAFRSQLVVLADRRTGLVTIEVKEASPQLALQLASVLLEEIERYNRETRQSRAAAERRFVESRLVAARKEVTASEDSLQQFLVTNRQYQTSPELRFRFERLQRSVTHRAGVVSSLAQNFEQTRIDEVRDTPVISIVQPPQLAARADPRGSTRALALGMAGGVMIAFLLRLFLGSVARLRMERPEEYEGWLATLRDLRSNILRR